MTANALLSALLPLLDDLAHELPEGERYQRLLDALLAFRPCDAVALLRLDNERLVPLAVRGLTADTLGRRFRITEHPRFARLLAQRGALRFAADCELPDPYDGLVEGHSEPLRVHDCLGCPLRIDGQTWGLLTLDSLQPGHFDTLNLQHLEAFARLAAAVVKAGERPGQPALGGADGAQAAASQRLVVHQAAARELIGQSHAHHQLLNEITLVGASTLAVLVSGETGVGKELVAQAIHNISTRAHKPLVSLNCAALPDSLVESELFGHTRGAFSGAVSERRGKFELADGGSLLLDEVGELPLAVQAKLLRVLESGQLQRLGSDQEHRVDVRVIAATNRDLAEEVQAGRFRADLYHRLAAYPLRVPPLRERGRDVLLLAGFFLEENRARLGLHGLSLSAEAQTTLLAYAWPGNVRELQHLIDRAALKAVAGNRGRHLLVIGAELLELPSDHGATPLAVDDIAGPPESAVDLRHAVEQFQRQLIAAALERHQHNRAAVARELGLDPANLNRLSKRLGLR